MSLAGIRARIAAALSTVDGVTGHEHRPAGYAEGDAWPVLGPGDRAAGDAFQLTWGVRVIAPQDEAAADAWWDERWPALYEVIQRGVGHVLQFVPISIPAQGGDLLGFQINFVTEE